MDIINEVKSIRRTQTLIEMVVLIHILMPALRVITYKLTFVIAKLVLYLVTNVGQF